MPASEFSMKLMLAHELGHHILGHVNQYHLEQEQEANAMAVKILQVCGMSEEEAFRGWRTGSSGRSSGLARTRSRGTPTARSLPTSVRATPSIRPRTRPRSPRYAPTKRL